LLLVFPARGDDTDGCGLLTEELALLFANAGGILEVADADAATAPAPDDGSLVSSDCTPKLAMDVVDADGRWSTREPERVTVDTGIYQQARTNGIESSQIAVAVVSSVKDNNLPCSSSSSSGNQSLSNRKATRLENAAEPSS
jgi:hypothetical protein